MADIPTFSFKVDGKTYSVQVNDLNGTQAKAFRKAVGVSLFHALQGVGDGSVDPLEVTAGFKWLIDRKDNPDLEYETVLEAVTYDNLDLTADEEAVEPDPLTQESVSESTSPPSPTSTDSSPGTLSASPTASLTSTSSS